jgi:hypothetical protein
MDVRKHGNPEWQNVPTVGVAGDHVAVHEEEPPKKK